MKMNHTKYLLVAATLSASALTALAQYTPGSGGIYIGPTGPTGPQPPAPPTVIPGPSGAPTYSWETPTSPQPQPTQIIAPPPPGYTVVQPPPQVYIPRISDAQIADLTSSIALYPDPLLSEMLPAMTYVEELTYVDKWMSQHPGADDRLLGALPIHDSVRAMAHYPSILNLMTDHLDWTQALGAAFTYQSQDVMESVQRWRATAVDCGYLYSTPQQEVLRQGTYVLIQPAPRTEVIYVPVYDPAVVYVRTRVGPPPRDVIRFSAGSFSLTFIDNDVDWRTHEVHVPIHDHDHDRDGRGPGDRGGSGDRGGTADRGGRGGGSPPPTRTVFVRDTLKPSIVYPEKIVTPTPDHKVVTLPTTAPATTTTAPARGPGGRGR